MVIYLFFFNRTAIALPQVPESEVSGFDKLPLEIITKILNNLTLKDIIALTKVSKAWRTKYLNQNTIWKRICDTLDILPKDYNDSHFEYNSEAVLTNSHSWGLSVSEAMFGPMCKWWTYYSRFQLVIHNILKNDFPVIHLHRKSTHQIFCTDNYIISLNRNKETAIQSMIFESSTAPLRDQFLSEFKLFSKLLKNNNNIVKIIGNAKFLVFEIHSIIFVYKFKNGCFTLKYCKTIQKSGTTTVGRRSNMPTKDFLKENRETVIDIHENQLVLAQQNKNLMFLIDLVTGTVCKELEYSEKNCVVDCLKCDDHKLMIGISIKVNCNFICIHITVIRLISK